MELDHITVFVTTDAPELAALESLGLQPLGEKTEHTGMGTASTAIFFDNAYLELIWIADPTLTERKWLGEAGSDLRKRVPGGSALPFGVVLRLPQGTGSSPPFPTKSVTADWMKPPLSILVAGEDSEPFCLIIPPELYHTSFKGNLPPTKHPLGVRAITGVRIVAPDLGKRSPVTEVLQEAGLVAFEAGARPMLELTFDGGELRQTVSAMPTLPVTLRY
jgi:hypothetical protein